MPLYPTYYSPKREAKLCDAIFFPVCYICGYNETVNKASLALCWQRLQQDLHPESAQLMSSDAMMERASKRDIVVTVNIIVLTALMSSIAVRWVWLLRCPTGFTDVFSGRVEQSVDCVCLSECVFVCLDDKFQTEWPVR